MLLGLVVLIQALNSDIAVTVYGGREVTNVGLMHDRLVMMILSGFIFFGGLLLRMFGDSLGADGSGYLLAIDKLSRKDYWLRITSAILVSGCVWVVLIMYCWFSILSYGLLLAAVSWVVFQPNGTYSQLRRVWLATLVLAAALAAFHVFSFAADWITYLTKVVYLFGVDILRNTKPAIVLGVMSGGPLALSVVGFLYVSGQAKSNPE
jgi:hypothetical protein